MYLFQLGREFKLAVAELQAVFPDATTAYHDKQIILLDNIDQETILAKASHLGGTIKIAHIIKDPIIDYARKSERKYAYGVSVFGELKNLKTIIMGTKKELKAEEISGRFINKEFKNPSSAQILGEKLIKNESDFSYVYIHPESTDFDDSGYLQTGDHGDFLLFQSIWVQDIESYSKRDYDKSRDMQIGMLPPKLSQIMINLSGGTTIYDPFVGLGTILIESVYMNNTAVFGSDLNEKMVETAAANLEKLVDTHTFGYKIAKLNAKFIHESSFFSHGVDAIVTEGYLGEIMTKSNISPERIKKQRETLEKIYIGFFQNLSAIKFKGTIVISFPFWEMKGIYQYFEEIYPIMQRYCMVQPLLVNIEGITTTKSGSLLYKRDKQLVGREICKLTMKG